jgi:hypothetical protein
MSSLATTGKQHQNTQKPRSIIYVQKLPSHKNLNTTLQYTQLIALPQNEEYICNVAKNVEGGPVV